MQNMRFILFAFGVLSVMLLGMGIDAATNSLLWSAATMILIGLPCISKMPIIPTILLGATQYFLIGQVTWHFAGLVLIILAIMFITKVTSIRYIK